MPNHKCVCAVSAWCGQTVGPLFSSWVGPKNSSGLWTSCLPWCLSGAHWSHSCSSRSASTSWKRFRPAAQPRSHHTLLPKSWVEFQDEPKCPTLTLAVYFFAAVVLIFFSYQVPPQEILHLHVPPQWPKIKIQLRSRPKCTCFNETQTLLDVFTYLYHA